MNVENKQSEELGNPKFKKRDGTSTGDQGRKYEVKLLMLYLLHGLSSKIDFWLASNIEGFGAFDDIFFEYIDFWLASNIEVLEPLMIFFLSIKIRRTNRELSWFKLNTVTTLVHQRILLLKICLLMETIESDRKRISG
ncbi:hypothetical protein [Wolbachia endosymbiont (group A) of Pipizella viduata]|uniref:hypothetical protein n=1 Tax=Wolbachia endosymbiont (group A) of Pipizella viduata TaxID=3066154 RepID=UPI00333FF227